MEFDRIAGVLDDEGASHRQLQIGRVGVAMVCHCRNSTAGRPARQDGARVGKE